MAIPSSRPRPVARGGSCRVERPSLHDKPLIVEGRSLRSALRAPVETTEFFICDSPLSPSWPVHSKASESTRRRSGTANGRRRKARERRAAPRRRPRSAARPSGRPVGLNGVPRPKPSTRGPIPRQRAGRVAGGSAHGRPPRHCVPSRSDGPPSFPIVEESAAHSGPGGQDELVTRKRTSADRARPLAALAQAPARGPFDL